MGFVRGQHSRILFRRRRAVMLRSGPLFARGRRVSCGRFTVRRRRLGVTVHPPMNAGAKRVQPSRVFVNLCTICMSFSSLCMISTSVSSNSVTICL